VLSVVNPDDFSQFVLYSIQLLFPFSLGTRALNACLVEALLLHNQPRAQ
jgi:hypothetical protein